MGPIRDKGKKERIVSYIEKRKKEGAKLILDGKKVNIIGDYPDSCFLGPTLFEEANPNMTIAQEEIFGPVATFKFSGNSPSVNVGMRASSQQVGTDNSLLKRVPHL